MHFIGMLAFAMPVAVEYHIDITLYSLLIAILASGFALWLVTTTEQLKHMVFMLGGLVMGIGIASMHYIGMKAMHMAAKIEYDPWLFFISIIIAIVASTAALYISYYLRDSQGRKGLGLRLMASLVMGFAIAGMHYVGISAAIFIPVGMTNGGVIPVLDTTTLAVAIAIVVTLIQGVSLLTSVFDQQLAAKKLALRAEEKYRIIMNSILDGVITIDNQGQIEAFNPSAESIFGYSSDEIQGKNINVLMPEPYHSEHDGYLKDYYETGVKKVVGMVREVTGLRKDGSTFSMDLAVAEVKEGLQQRFVGIVRDITVRKEMENKLHKSEERLKVAQLISKVGDWEWDITTDKLYWSDEVYRIFGQQPGMFQASFEAFKQAIHPEDQVMVQQAIESSMSNGHLFSLDYRIVLPDGDVRWVHEEGKDFSDEEGKPIRRQGTVHDITERKLAEQNINFLATHDPLTKLPNRTLLMDRINQAKSVANRNKNKFAVLFFDLDNFKPINDQFGHGAGDAILCEVAKRCKQVVRDADTIARFGGDEFVVVLHALKEPSAVKAVAEKIINNVMQPITIDGTELTIGCSIGIAIYPDDALEAEELISRADVAMYRAKQSGKNQFQFVT